MTMIGNNVGAQRQAIDVRSRTTQGDPAAPRDVLNPTGLAGRASGISVCAGVLGLLLLAVVAMFDSTLAAPEDRRTDGAAPAESPRKGAESSTAVLAAKRAASQSQVTGATARNTSSTGEKGEGGQTKVAKKLPARAAGGSASRIEITPAREAAALAFAREHHPELARLLQTLRKLDRQEYLRAVRELYRQSERLAKMKDRGDWRYDLALQMWVVESRLQVLSARYATTEDERLLPQIRELIRERRLLERELLVREQRRLEARLGKLKEAVERLDADMERSIEDELKRLVRKAQSAAVLQRAETKRRSNSGQPAARTTTRTTDRSEE